MIRVVFDANVLVSGFPTVSGPIPELLDKWRAEDIQLVISRHIIGEVRRGWSKPYWRARLSQPEIERAIDLLEQDAEVTPITVQVTGVATHASDDLVLATAVSGNVEFLVTSDIPFRGVGSYRGITILTPREFLALLEQREE